MDQLSPACAPSSTRNSKCLGSSCTGTPHSRSWYWSISGSSKLTQLHRFVVINCRRYGISLSEYGAISQSEVSQSEAYQLGNRGLADREILQAAFRAGV